MSGAWDDIGARPLPETDPHWDSRNAAFHRETYAEALARSLVGKVDGAPTEQEIAAKIVADRERMKFHDDVFADNFIPALEQQIISRTLARQLGYFWHDNSLSGDDGQDDFENPSGRGREYD